MTKSRAVLIVVDEFAEFTLEDFKKVQTAMLRLGYAGDTAPDVQTIHIGDRDTGRRSKDTYRPFSGVLQSEPPLRRVVCERDTKLPE